LQDSGLRDSGRLESVRQSLTRFHLVSSAPRVENRLAAADLRRSSFVEIRAPRKLARCGKRISGKIVPAHWQVIELISAIRSNLTS
jgi:hypothetical protein